MIENEQQALITGYTLGILMRAKLDVRPEIDDAGDYTPRLLMTIPGWNDGDDLQVWLTVELA